jgi:signal transduction histidine kinase
MIENSLRAGAGAIAVRVWIEPDRELLTISVDDDGPGLGVKPGLATNPFFTTKKGKKTGLGLALFREAVEAAGGDLALHRSAELGGLAIEAVMRLSHVDRPPLGDVVASVAVMAATNPAVALRLEVATGAEFCQAGGAELVAFGPVTEACRRLLSRADAASEPITAEEKSETVEDTVQHDTW